MRLSSWMQLCLQPEAPPAFTPTGPVIHFPFASIRWVGNGSGPPPDRAPMSDSVTILVCFVFFFLVSASSAKLFFSLIPTLVGLQYAFPPCRRPKCQLRIQLECNGYCVSSCIISCLASGKKKMQQEFSSVHGWYNLSGNTFYGDLNSSVLGK